MTSDQVRRVVGYVRVSRDEQVRSGLGLKAQEELLRRACAARGWEVLEVIREEGVSGAVPWQERAGLSRAIAFLSPSQRPARSKSASHKEVAGGGAPGIASMDEVHHMSEIELAQAGKKLEMIDNPRVDPKFSALARRNQGGWRASSVREFAASGRKPNREPRRADALVVAKLDRLSRSVLDFASVAETARAEGWALVILDPEFDMSTPTGELLVGMLAQFAQFERRLIGQRTKEALAAKKASGWRPGRPRETTPLQNQLIWDLRTGIPDQRPGLTLMGIKTYLDQLPGEQWAPPRGRRWSLDTIRRVIRDMAVDAL